MKLVGLDPTLPDGMTEAVTIRLIETTRGQLLYIM